MIRFSCPRCQALLSADDREAGGKHACATCGQLMRVPIPETAIRAADAALPSPAPPTASPRVDVRPAVVLAPGAAGKGPVALLAGLGLGLLAVVGTVVALLVWQPWVGKTTLDDDQLHFVPDNPDFVAAVDVQGLLASEVYHKIDRAIQRQQGGRGLSFAEAEVRREIGISWSDWTRVLVGGRFGDKVNAPPEITLAIQTRQPLRARDLLRKSKEGNFFTEEKVGPYTMYKYERGGRGEPFAFCVARESTLVLGPTAVVRQILRRDKAPTLSESLRSAMRQTDFSRTIALATGKLPEKLRESIMTQAPAVNPRLAQWSVLWDNYKGGTLEIQAGADVRVKSVTFCPDAKAAREAATVAKGLIGLIRLLPEFPPALNDFADSIEVSASDSHFTTTMTLDVDKFIQLLERRRPF
jgi:hypothetical protein